MKITVRPAQGQDAAGILEIIQLALQDNPSIAHVEAALAAPEHVAFVALVEDKVVGFAGGFVTPTPQQMRRWELDLLGVHPDYRNLGIGRTVTRSCTDAGRELNTTFAQGLVKTSNVASQKAFAAAGYTLDETVCGLFVGGGDLYKAAPIPLDAHLIPVTTLTYHGVWMEGAITPLAIEAAQAWRTHEKRDNIGAVVPLHDAAAVKTLRAADFDFIGEFQWWRVHW